MLIAVTGGIGCGKTLVARQLSELLKAPYYNSDEICRELLLKGQPGYLQFVVLFGDRFLDKDKNIDRSLLRTQVFSNDTYRSKLELILHPLVHERILAGSEKESIDTPVIAEVPLLFESGWEQDFDRIICVVAAHDTAVQRIMDRDLVDRAAAERIIEVQMDIDEKADRSDWVIDNDGDAERTRKQVSEVAEMIRDRPEK